MNFLVNRRRIIALKHLNFAVIRCEHKSINHKNCIICLNFDKSTTLKSVHIFQSSHTIKKALTPHSPAAILKLIISGQLFVHLSRFATLNYSAGCPPIRRRICDLFDEVQPSQTKRNQAKPSHYTIAPHRRCTRIP